MMNKTTKHVIQIAALALGALTLNQAMAHGGGKPQHGGVVQVANDVSFELVAETDGATIYLVDHGSPMPSKGIAGKLTVLQGSNKTEVEVRSAGDNKLRATGVKLAKGDKVVAVLNNVEGKTATVRFTVK
jgi:hypothetical protein